jgi:hypothetical protein
MAGKLSEIFAAAPATAWNEGDAIIGLQAGGDVGYSKTILRSKLFSDPAFATLLPQPGDTVRWDGTDWKVTGQLFGDAPSTSRWRVVHTDAYTEAAPASTSTITFAGGGPTNGIATSGTSWFAVGLPVRFKHGSTYYYAICTAITTTLLTIAGAPLIAATAITELAVGTPDMLKTARLFCDKAGYATSTTLTLPYGCIHRWRGPTGWLVSYSVAHMNTGATTVVNLQLNGGSNVSPTGITVPAAASSTVNGAWAELASPVDLTVANLSISDKQNITAKTPTAVANSDYLNIDCLFVVP